jgi:hypothetical protein
MNTIQENLLESVTLELATLAGVDASTDDVSASGTECAIREALEKFADAWTAPVEDDKTRGNPSCYESNEDGELLIYVPTADEINLDCIVVIEHAQLSRLNAAVHAAAMKENSRR